MTHIIQPCEICGKEIGITITKNYDLNKSMICEDHKPKRRKS